jgi:golgi phosphoprotein 3
MCVLFCSQLEHVLGNGNANGHEQEISKAKDRELQLEVVAACLNVFTRLDSLL